MSKIIRAVGIPVLTLLIGWNLGVSYVQHRVNVLQPALTGSGQVLTNPEQEADISLLWHVWKVLGEHYIEPQKLTENTLVLGAIEGLVRSVGDPYTVFMSPKENTDFRDALAGKLEGIGAELGTKDGLITVVTPIKGSPAERAGLLPEDIIAEVDGESIDGLNLNAVVQRIRGKKGTQVTLTVYRKSADDPVTLVITRDEIHVPSVESRVIESEGQQIGYISLNQFGETSIDEVRSVLQEFRGKPLKGIVLDLRQNGGGYLDGAIALVSLFARTGVVVTVEQRGFEPRSESVSGNALFPDTPLVVLQNEASASASEIAAGALQDNGRATVIGKTSFGKGTVQEVIDVPGGGSLRVTVAKWKTPKGKDLSKEGVHPDIEVERTVEDFQAGIDPQLDAGVEWLLHGRVTNRASSSSSASAL